jgi:hypothetical protein
LKVAAGFLKFYGALPEKKYFFISCGKCRPTPLAFVIGVYSVKIILFIIGQGSSRYLPIGLTNSLIVLWNI